MYNMYRKSFHSCAATSPAELKVNRFWGVNFRIFNQVIPWNDPILQLFEKED